MRADLADAVETNVVLILDHPPSGLSDLIGLISTDRLLPVMKRPVSYSQGLVIEGPQGAIPSHQLVSIPSRKSLTVNNGRLELHDLSGEFDWEGHGLHRDVAFLIDLLGVTSVKAIGANYLATFTVPDGRTAVQYIGERFIGETASFLPRGLDVDGGQLRLYLTRNDSAKHVLSLEPRLQDPSSRDIFVSCNTETTTTGVPTTEQLAQILQDGYDLLSHVVEALAPTTLQTV